MDRLGLSPVPSDDVDVIMKKSQTRMWKTLQGEPQFTPYTTQIGEYNYADTIDYEGGFRMTGQITVVADQQNTIADTTTNNTADTLGLLMVPADVVGLDH